MRQKLALALQKRLREDSPSSMFTCVIGFPVPLCVGIALTSILDVETGGSSALPPLAFAEPSLFMGALLTVASFDVVR